MKHSKLLLCLLFVGVATILSSCGGGGNEKTPATDSTAAADSAAKSKPVSTVVTTPQNLVVVQHKVANYAKWLSAYEADDSARLVNGFHNYVIGRGLMDSNMVILAMKIDDTAKARAFGMTPALKAVMKKAGVIGTPTMDMVTETWQDTVTLATTIRSRTSLMVKDWDAFVKGFQDGKQERMDNGITDRVIGHDLNDNKKVTLVTALSDTAKALAYYKSDALKKRRSESGVIGEPVRFLYRIVKKY